MFTIVFQGDIFADYFQVVLRDEAHPELPDEYTDEAIARHLTSGRHAVILHTARNMTVPICVEWHAEQPDLDVEAYQHIVEASVLNSTGRLILAGLTDDHSRAPRITVQAGWVRVRACLAGLDTLDETGLDGGDTYLLQLWPEAERKEISVLKSAAGG